MSETKMYKSKREWLDWQSQKEQEEDQRQWMDAIEELYLTIGHEQREEGELWV